jgi:magnesium-transporting ATPase (P-type)
MCRSKRCLSRNLLISIDLLFTTLPPALSLCFSLNSMILYQRLKSRKISLTKPSYANFAGRMKMVIFDKTGTLTKATLKLQSVTLLDMDLGLARQLNMEQHVKENLMEEKERLLLHGFVLNSQLYYQNGELIGDEMDRETLRVAKAKLYPAASSEPKSAELPKAFAGPLGDALFNFVADLHAQEMFKIELKFHFDYVHYRSSVIVKEHNTGERYLMSKGPCQYVLRVCKPHPLVDSMKARIEDLQAEGLMILCYSVKKLGKTVDLVIDVNADSGKDILRI